MRYFVLFGLICAGLASLTAVMFPDRMDLFGEAGPFEMVGMIALLLAAFVLLWHVPRLPAVFPILLLLLLAEREVEAEIWPEGSLLRTTLLWVEDSILHSQIGVVVLAGILIVTLSFFTVPYARGRPMRGSLQVQFLLVGVVFAFLGQLGEVVVDDLVSDPSDALRRAMLGAEEVSEAFFSIAILCATVAAVVRSRRVRNDADHHRRSATADAGAARRHSVLHDDAGDASGDDLSR